MVVEKHITAETELEITGATLLSLEEANLLPLKEREYDDGWWLLSPGIGITRAAYVFSSGVIYLYGYSVYDTDGCVRPALILRNLESSDFQVGDIFTIRDYRFKIINHNLAWMYEGDIGNIAFREDWKAKDANIYDKSDVKKCVDKWFKELKK